MTVYLIHFQTNLKHARHYVGFAQRVSERLAHHRDGSGARILAACNALGIEYDIARTWEGKGRDFERLRMYFRLNFTDGQSDGAFLKWVSDMVKQSARESLYITKVTP